MKKPSDIVHELFISFIENDDIESYMRCNDTQCDDEECQLYLWTWRYMKYQNNYSEEELNNIINIYKPKV